MIDIKKLMPPPFLASDKNQAISFKAIKACYPFTIKGGLFSLLCCQPRAVPVSLKALMPRTTPKHQYLPLIWNGQAKARPPQQVHSQPYEHIAPHDLQCHREPKNSQATPKLYLLITYK